MDQSSPDYVSRLGRDRSFQSRFPIVDDDDDIYLAKKPGYQKGHKPINAGCPYKKILYVNIISIINIINN